MAALDGFLYVVGGRSESGAAIASVERYNPVAEQWTNVSPMRNARVGAGLEVSKMTGISHVCIVPLMESMNLSRRILQGHARCPVL